MRLLTRRGRGVNSNNEIINWFDACIIFREAVDFSMVHRYTGHCTDKKSGMESERYQYVGVETDCR